MISELYGEILIIRLPAHLDARGVSQAEGAFGTAIQTHTGPVLVDMQEVTFAASLAFQMLLYALKYNKQNGSGLYLSGLQPHIADIFRKSCLDILFTIYPNRETALTDLCGVA
jgi:anti-anti-sigma factor